MIQIGFSTHKNNILSKIIRWITKSPISHCWILYYDIQFKIEMVLESTTEGFRILPFKTYQKQNDNIVLFNPKFSLTMGLIKAGEKLGTKYDFKGLFGSIFPIIGRWFKRKWKNPFYSSKELFCSEAVTEIMKDSKYPGSDKFDPSTTNPNDLYNFFKKETEAK